MLRRRPPRLAPATQQPSGLPVAASPSTGSQRHLGWLWAEAALSRSRPRRSLRQGQQNERSWTWCRTSAAADVAGAVGSFGRPRTRGRAPTSGAGPRQGRATTGRQTGEIGSNALAHSRRGGRVAGRRISRRRSCSRGCAEPRGWRPASHRQARARAGRRRRRPRQPGACRRWLLRHPWRRRR